MKLFQNEIDRCMKWNQDESIKISFNFNEHSFKMSSTTLNNRLQLKEIQISCCTRTFQPLSLSDCQRDGEIRLRATRWVRLAVPPK